MASIRSPGPGDGAIRADPLPIRFQSTAMRRPAEARARARTEPRARASRARAGRSHRSLPAPRAAKADARLGVEIGTDRPRSLAARWARRSAGTERARRLRPG